MRLSGYQPCYLGLKSALEAQDAMEKDRTERKTGMEERQEGKKED
jgi:hypothetical protein